MGQRSRFRTKSIVRYCVPSTGPRFLQQTSPINHGVKTQRYRDTSFFTYINPSKAKMGTYDGQIYADCMTVSYELKYHGSCLDTFPMLFTA